MAEGLKAPSLTQLEFKPADHRKAETIAKMLGYEQYAYTSTSGLWGLFCLPENPEHHAYYRSVQTRNLPPFRHGCIIKTAEFGLMFVQTEEDLRS